MEPPSFITSKDNQGYGEQRGKFLFDNFILYIAVHEFKVFALLVDLFLWRCHNADRSFALNYCGQATLRCKFQLEVHLFLFLSLTFANVFSTCAGSV